MNCPVIRGHLYSLSGPTPAPPLSVMQLVLAGRNQGHRLGLSRPFVRALAAPSIFHGARASIMIPTPSNTLPISPCTRLVSDFKNS